MKRVDLPNLATVEMPDKSEFLLVNGSAAGTHLFSVARLPNGLPPDAISHPKYPVDQPLVALVIPASMVERVDYEILRQIGDAEKVELEST